MSHKGSKAASPATMPMMTLEVRVVSGEDVRVPSGRPLCHGAYAVVHGASSSAATRVDQDPDCHGYPYWDEAVRVALPAGVRWLDVEICRAHPAGGGSRSGETVAAALVPVEDFTVGPPGHLHCLSYRLFGSAARGMLQRRNGIVNITVTRLDGAAPPPPEVKAVMFPQASAAAAAAAATGKAVDASAGASGGGSSSCGAAVVEQGKPAAPAGAVMGYPVGC